MNENKVFISYRRDTVGNAFAGRIYDTLKHYGYDVYLDVENLSSGKWKKQLLEEVEKRNHFIIVLTPNSLNSCNSSSDMVRLEFEQAIATNSNIVPVKEESQTFRDIKTNCPAPMKKLFDNQGIEIRHNSFQSDIEKLIKNFIPPVLTSKETNTNIFFTILVLLSAIITFNFGITNSNWNYSSFLLISFCLLMFRNIYTLPKEIKTFAYISLFMIALGSIILFERIFSKQEIGNLMAIIGISVLAFGFGLGTVVPNYRVNANKIIIKS